MMILLAMVVVPTRKEPSAVHLEVVGILAIVAFGLRSH
jgi:hypothetical protein